MKNWIARMFGQAEPRQQPGTVQARTPEPEVQLTESELQNLDYLFYRWLSGAGDSDAAAGTDTMLLGELERLAATPYHGANLIPRVPAIIPRLLRDLRDDNVSTGELARLLTQDVVLVAEVIREVNSSFYNPATPIKTVEAALRLLGENGLRLLLARVSFRKVINLQSGRYVRVVAPLVWAQSEKCAQAASLFAPQFKVNPFDAFLCGLVHNVGLMVAFRLIDQIYDDEPMPQSEAFVERLFDQARPLAAGIANLWEFPPEVGEAILRSGHMGGPGLARALTRADRVSKLRMLVDAGAITAEELARVNLDEAAKAVFDKLQEKES
jgi:HD-like signal output (HDOD) protein